MSLQDNSSRAYAPHCDSSILHSPGVCEYCDLYPDWQDYRRIARIAYSDMKEPSLELAPCPSEWFRSPKTRDLWNGNVPKPGCGCTSHSNQHMYCYPSCKFEGTCTGEF